MLARKGWLLIVLLAAGARFAPAAALDEIYPVEWRNVPFKQAVEELAGQYSLPVLFDASVTPEIAQAPVRLFARHLTGRQALKWLARWGGVEAVFVDGSLLIARPERLPRIWQKEVAASANHSRTTGGSATVPSSVTAVVSGLPSKNSPKPSRL